MTSIYDFSVSKADGTLVQMADYRDRVLLIVNTARLCGLAPQFTQLQALYEKYSSKGFLVLAFPCNQFLNQEPDSSVEIVQACEVSLGLTFPVFAKIEVNGGDAHPLYVFLKKKAPGFLGSEAIKWNFTKFLIGRDGEKVSRFAPQVEPNSIEKEIIALL
jgi:glutathione peroxidase